MWIVGLTGGIATGKSTATAFFRAEGVPVIDLDELARVVVQPGRPALREICRAFGPAVLLSDGSLDRPALGKVIFADPSKRRLLNKLTHGPIVRELLSELCVLFASGEELVVIDAPLLFESKLHLLCARVLAIGCSEEQQLKRLMARDSLSSEDAALRVRAQMPLHLKLARADHVVDNSGSREEGKRLLAQAWEDIARARPRKAQRRWPWARLPRARNLALSVTLWLVLGAVRLLPSS